jgi:carboxyl-terminal processing protease
MKKVLCALLLLIALTVGAAAQSAPVTSQSVSSASARTDATSLRQEAFDIVWRTVKEKHFDPTFGGVDWDAMREKYQPKVAAAKSDREFYGLLQQMLEELGQSHFAIIPPEAVVEDKEVEPVTGTAGIDLRIIDNLVVITSVEPGSGAARAGLRMGFVIKQVGETPVEKVIERFAKSKESPAIVQLRITRSLLARINGRADSSVRIVYLDGKDQTREAEVSRTLLTGDIAPGFANFPPQYTEFEARRLEGGIGYIRFNIFALPLMEKIRPAIRSMNGAPGIIIDLRGNPGGFGAMSNGMAGLMTTEQTSLGRMRMRTGYMNFPVYPQVDPFKGKVVILIDGGSASTSEIFAAGMREIGRATVVGETSMGAALPSLFQKLPTGALFQYAFADFKSPKGSAIEGRGVTPDVEVKLTRAELLKGRDPQLEAAIAQIKKP